MQTTIASGFVCLKQAKMAQDNRQVEYTAEEIKRMSANGHFFFDRIAQAHVSKQEPMSDLCRSSPLPTRSSIVNRG